MAMNDVWPRFEEKGTQSKRKHDIQIATTGNVMNRQVVPACCGIDAASRRAHDGAGNASAPQPTTQVEHLLGAPIEVAAGFDVDYFHRHRGGSQSIDLARHRG